MHFPRSTFALAVFALASGAQAQISGGVVKIGVLSDMSSLYSDIGGPGRERQRRQGHHEAGQVHVTTPFCLPVPWF